MTLRLARSTPEGGTDDIKIAFLQDPLFIKCCSIIPPMECPIRMGGVSKLSTTLQSA